LVAGKMGREGWFSANFEFDFLLPQNVNLLLFIGVEEGNLVFTGE
jgi:hypothetical protein